MPSELEPPAPRFRERFPRPNFMTLTVFSALLSTPSVGQLGAPKKNRSADQLAD